MMEIPAILAFLSKEIPSADFEAFENPKPINVFDDFKTECFPPRAQYYVARNRRDLEDRETRLKDLNLTETLIWADAKTPSRFSDTARSRQINAINSYLRNGTNMRDIIEDQVDVNQESPSEKDVETHNSDSDDARERQLKNILEHALNWSPWEKPDDPEDGGEQEDDKSEKDTVIFEEINPDQGPAIQHAFWKGEGNEAMIRRDQGILMKQYMDSSVDPCKDFYQFACGRWTKLNPIPKDKGAYDTFEMLRESLDSILKELLEEPASQREPEAYVKAKDLYKSCVNYDVLEQRGSKPLLALLEKLGGWPLLDPEWDRSTFDWLWLMAQLRLFNNDILVSEWVGPDIKNSDLYVIHLDQTSLGLPTRDYYLQPSNLQYLEAYKNYLAKVATLLGAPASNATVAAEEVIQFEVALAKITSAPDERRNVSELYQRMTVAELRSYIPQVNWQRYLSIVLGRPCNASESVVVFALRYLEDLVSLLGKTEPKTISNYLLWRFVRHRVNNLDDRFQEAKQKFYYILFGREESPPRWKNCIAQVNGNMGMAVGAMFVRKYFDEFSKNDTLIMTREIQQSFREILEETSWIDKETKRLAKDKVDAMALRIGYPDSILDKKELDERYKDVKIDSNLYFENTLNILRHLTRMEQSHLGTPVNKSIWNTAPAVVNAYYSRNKNQIMFPAGILQPPFYHRYFPKSLNYGGIGVVIGHEITHGFDDKGRLFDRNGNLHRWWREEAVNQFHDRAQCIIDQYGKYVVDEVGIQIDGTNTQGENIADNGGIKQAFRAYQKWLSLPGKKDETLPGLNYTGTQLFFLNFAQVWCGETRPAASRNKLKTAVHSPGKFRVIGTLSNSVEFAKVFNCPLGSPMNPAKKCTVW
ncbi:Peptidase family M13 [Nesidiocoris tenuis]|uniref:Peptidase family M13 n=1 Tax=Nesidiocoris tenuis TaxID=355587 RepID=A0ABN7AIH1_9HEMI|nr:Peptidase family M13 [Nesidiocoris tenuis]